MDAELLNLLVCPKTKRKLILAPPELIDELNGQISDGKCTNIGGEKISDPVEEALFEAEGKVIYLILESIPVLIYENGIILTK
ncbi:MAG: hypothetical protein ABUK01_00190 [Leptospirales bacterium]